MSDTELRRIAERQHELEKQLAAEKEARVRLEERQAALRKDFADEVASHRKTKERLQDVLTQLKAGVWSIRIVAAVGAVVATYFGLAATILKGPTP